MGLRITDLEAQGDELVIRATGTPEGTGVALVTLEVMDRLAALLERVEWIVHEPGEIDWCPCCERQTEWTGNDGTKGGGHAPDCELAALKAELEKLK